MSKGVILDACSDNTEIKIMEWSETKNFEIYPLISKLQGRAGLFDLKNLRYFYNLYYVKTTKYKLNKWY